MKTKTNKLFSSALDIFFPVLFIGMLICGFLFYDDLTFIPELSFCAANSPETLISIIQNLCQVPVLRRVVLILNTKIIFILVIYAIIFFSIFSFLKRIGYKELKKSTEQIETKENKEKVKKQGIYIFFITLILIIMVIAIFGIE